MAEESKKTDESCCDSKQSCRCGCGGKRCCFGKAALLIVIIGLAGVIGYFCGVGCGGKRGMMCPMAAMSHQGPAPTTPPTK